MASIAGMDWSAARRAFIAGYDAYQVLGPRCRCPYTGRDNKCVGLYVAGKDAARNRVPRDKAWRFFRKREERVQ